MLLIALLIWRAVASPSRFLQSFSTVPQQLPTGATRPSALRQTMNIPSELFYLTSLRHVSNALI